MNGKKTGLLDATRKDDVIKLCQELIGIPSFSGEEREVADLLNKRLQSSGLEAKIDEFGNLIAVLRGGKPGPKLMFIGHTDIAAIGRREEWRQDPFSPVIEDGILYGRGACDMKAALAGMTVAAEKLSQMRRSLRGELILTFVAQEEQGNGMSHVLQDDAFIPNWAIEGEPTNMNIALGHRCGALIELKVSGQSAHMSHFPKRGVDAVGNMMELLQEIKKFELPKDERFGDSSYGITTIMAEPNQVGLINDKCTVQLAFLLAEIGEIPQEPINKLLAKLNETIDNLGQRIPDLKAEAKALATHLSFYASPDDPQAKPLIDSLRKHIKTVTFRTPDLFTWTFGTAGSYLSNFFNVPVVGLGPGSEFNAHVPTDCVELTQIIEATEVYILTALDLLGQREEDLV